MKMYSLCVTGLQMEGLKSLRWKYSALKCTIVELGEELLTNLSVVYELTVLRLQII
jgi:hypothetical protein